MHKNQFKLLIATPAYNSLVHTDYLHTLLNLKIPYSVITLGNESLITRARNKLFSLFINYSQFSHLLFLDADIGINPEDIKKLISYNKNLIGAAVPLKHPTQIIFNYGKILDDSNYPLVEVDRVGCAVMLISRKLALDLASYAEKQGWVYNHNPFYSRGDNLGNFKIYDIFKVGIFNGEYLSEDYFFCKLCRELGYKVYVDLSIKVRHNGMLPIEIK